MKNPNDDYSCGSASHFSRRTLLKAAGMAGLTWLTPLSQLLALDAEKKKAPARSVILLWLGGAASQLETFDPHPGSPIAYGTKGINTALKGIQLAAGMEQTASILDELCLVRSVTSKEGDHERATYNIKTGYRPNPALTHPSLGSVICHEMPDQKIEIPTHVSILPGQWPARGGYLGAQYDAFQVGDPTKSIPDVTSMVTDARRDERLEGLSVVEKAFARGRSKSLDQNRTLHQVTIQNALKMMTSDQLSAFNVNEVPEAERLAYGDTPFGRGCLAARRLIEVGVRCVEVTLNGWDTHVNNHELQAGKVKQLDPAFTALIKDLKARGLLENTIVLCGGEFGRTPKLNGLEGRDHWPNGFSIALAGGGFKSGYVHGATDPTGESEEPENPVRVEDIHTTVHHLLGIESEKEIMTSIGRPIALSEGSVVRELIA